MSIHISRDYLPETTGYAANKLFINTIYQSSIFLHKVLGYSLVGQTNWNIDGYQFLIASGLNTDGYGAAITFDGYNTVSIPIFKKTVGAGDIGRILVLKSIANPTKNSGCFKITSINAGTNSYHIDYRSTDNPITEAAVLDWWLYEIETTVSNLLNNTGSGVGYSGGGATTNSRIILQSPHTSGWQVRITAEPTLANMPLVSFAVGYGGNASGDFATTGLHTHIAQYLNTNPAAGYINTLPGGGKTTVANRTTIVGDDTGQAVFLYTRSTGVGNNGLITFGIPDNEPSVIPNTERLFCYGGAPIADSGTIVIRMNDGYNVGLTNKNTFPTLCSLAGWANLDGTSATTPIVSDNAGDCPFLGTTEILPVEVWSGITGDVKLNFPQPVAGTVIYTLNPMLMGTAPFIRLGRANFGNFTLSTDVNKAWLHLQNGIYLQWNGTSIV